jgi:hypothetical protein
MKQLLKSAHVKFIITFPFNEMGRAQFVSYRANDNKLWAFMGEDLIASMGLYETELEMN